METQLEQRNLLQPKSILLRCLQVSKFSDDQLLPRIPCVVDIVSWTCLWRFRETTALILPLSMGALYRWRPAWWRKYNYLLGTGLDCG